MLSLEPDTILYSFFFFAFAGEPVAFFKIMQMRWARRRYCQFLRITHTEDSFFYKKLQFQSFFPRFRFFKIRKLDFEKKNYSESVMKMAKTIKMSRSPNHGRWMDENSLFQNAEFVFQSFHACIDCIIFIIRPKTSARTTRSHLIQWHNINNANLKKNKK